METVEPTLKCMWRYHEPRIDHTKLKNKDGRLPNLF